MVACTPSLGSCVLLVVGEWPGFLRCPCAQILWYDSHPERAGRNGRRGGTTVTFAEVVDQAMALLQRRGRVTYRLLKRQFTLDDEALEDLKLELIAAQR